LNECRDRIREGNVLGLADAVEYLVTLSSPHLDERQLAGLVIVQIEDEMKLFKRCQEVLRTILPILARAGLYAYLTPDVGDATGFALKGEKLGEGDEEEEVVGVAVE